MPHKQYPPQTGPYIVKVKSEQSTDSWRDFTSARLQISVGKEYHEGNKFAALMDWCRWRFEKITICANDTLQRFNIMFEQNIEETAANEEAEKLGEQWIRRNMPVISGVTQAKIVRWEEWKTNPEYSKGYLQAEWLYTNNDEFRNAIDNNIHTVWMRRAKKFDNLHIPENYERFIQLSRRYLLEEIAAFATMFKTEETIDIYPGSVLLPAFIFRGRAVEGAPDGLHKGHFCRVDFSKNDALTPL